MSNIYLNVTIKKKWGTQNFHFLSSKSLSPGYLLGSSNSHRYQWIFKLFGCKSKIRGLEAKLCAAFQLFLFRKELWRFKVKKSMYFVKQIYKFWYREMNLVLQLVWGLWIKSKAVMSSRSEKKIPFFVTFILSKRNFLTFAFYLKYIALNILSEYVYFYILHIKKHYLLLVFTIVESLKCILKPVHVIGIVSLLIYF